MIRKIPLTLFLSAIMLFSFIVVFPSTNVGAQTLQPPGVIALKITGIPSGTPSGSQLGWTFVSFVHNATLTEPYCTNNLNQTLSVDANNTLQADPNPTTPLSKVYALDYDPYIVDAYNDTTNYKAAGTFNLTLNNHYILNESWVKSITITIYANASMTMNTLARWYIYNFTDGSWVSLGDLNATSRSSLNSTLTSGLSDLIDEDHSNALMIKYNYTDTTNTDFALHIDCIQITVNYDLRIDVQSWNIENEEAVQGAEVVYKHVETVVFSAPSGVVQHNATVWFVSPSRSIVFSGTESVTVNGTAVSFTRFSKKADLSFSITNLVNNSTRIEFNLPPAYVISCNGTISGSYVTRRLEIIVSAPSGNITETVVYAGYLGLPVNLYINGQNVLPTTRSIYTKSTENCWYYDPDNSLIYIKVFHESSVTIIIDWTVPSEEAPPPQAIITPEQQEAAMKMFAVQFALIWSLIVAAIVFVAVPATPKIRAILAVLVFAVVFLVIANLPNMLQLLNKWRW
ncbi:MAG: hypothetical protein DRJ03_10080 [Chloroflexi bacterium]|nr:MAG: hypothetical protein DRJ03_10080 [Chloroflexota bacterium]